MISFSQAFSRGQVTGHGLIVIESTKQLATEALIVCAFPIVTDTPLEQKDGGDKDGPFAFFDFALLSVSSFNYCFPSLSTTSTTSCESFCISL